MNDFATNASWKDKAAAIRLEEYEYDLPDERIARYPLDSRDSSRLLVYDQGAIVHDHFSSIPGYLPAETLLVYNDTRVIPARVYFQKVTGATIELLLLHPELPTRTINDAMLIRNECVWECMIGNKKKWKTGDSLSAKLQVNSTEVELIATYHDFENNLVQLNWEADVTFLDIVQALGEIPLPPYLKRDVEEIDKTTYQTVYAKQEGAVAAPTAGLHFTERVFDQLDTKGIVRTSLTLHVGAGTFQPIKATSVIGHPMHAEQVVYTQELIKKLLLRVDHVIAVGTTSLRSLESLYWFGVKLFRKETTDFWIEKLYPYPLLEGELPSAREALQAILDYMVQNKVNQLVGETEIFIFPGYQFQICKGLITNYHQPGSTLVLLVAAFVGPDWKRIYDEAFEKGYRFLSYGDSSLLWRNQ
jgi:S-adenosylmethionine:tRNA ribosyltransferase-isomerase